MKKSTAILLAGGKGTRFDPQNLKTLYEINGKTLTELVIEDIQNSKLFDEIVLVYNSEKFSAFIQIAKDTGIKYVENGDTRFKSALNGVNASSNEKIVFIDVAAPFYQKKMLKNMLDILDDYNGVMSTILDTRADHVLVEGNEIKRVFKRGEILRVKSYQAINKTIWKKYVDKSKDLDVYTEMLKIMIDNGEKIGNSTSENNPRKITNKEDLRFFEKEGWE